MKKSEIWEGIIILISAVLLLPIWMVNSGHLVLSPTLLKVLSFLQYPNYYCAQRDFCASSPPRHPCYAR